MGIQKDYYLFKVGEIYYTQLRDPISGKLLSKKSLGETNKTLAEKRAKEFYIDLKIKSGKNQDSFYGYANLFYISETCPHEKNIKSNNKTFSTGVKKTYRSILENYILPDEICKMKIGFISRKDIVEFRNRLIDKKGHVRMSQLILQTLKNILHCAFDSGIIDTDVAHRVNIGYQKKGKIAINATDIKKLLAVDNWEYQRIRLAVMTGALLGIRAGEICGLKWKDLDFRKNIIHIERSISFYDGEKLPKSGKKRITVYPDILKFHMEPLRGEAEFFVFTDSETPLKYTFLLYEFKKALKKAGIPVITLHGLRHSINTLLRGAGVDSEILRASFGWEDAEIQENYTHRELYDLENQKRITDNIFNDL